jgi:hypothetical protein
MPVVTTPVSTLNLRDRKCFFAAERPGRKLSTAFFCPFPEIFNQGRKGVRAMEETREKLIEIIRILPADKIPTLLAFIEHLVKENEDWDFGMNEDELLMN